MSWYIIALLISTAPPASISFSMEALTLVPIPYATEAACKDAGAVKIDILNKVAAPIHQAPQNKKYIFVCTQL